MIHLYEPSQRETNIKIKNETSSSPGLEMLGIDVSKLSSNFV